MAKGVGISEGRASKIWQSYILRRVAKLFVWGKVIAELEKREPLFMEQKTHMQHVLIDKIPDQIKLPFILWTRDAVKILINQRYRVLRCLSETVGEHLKRWELTPQKPIKTGLREEFANDEKTADGGLSVYSNSGEEKLMNFH